MKSNYHEKREARLQKYASRVTKNRAAAQSLFKQSHDMTSCIPMGQPILVGHHSERGHRSLIKRSWNKLGQGVAALKKADHYESRLQAAESNHVISSDDPEAIAKLTKKLEGLQALQEFMKAANKIIKAKKLAEVEKVDQLVAMGISEARALSIMQPDFCNRIGFASYQLSNNNANIKTVKDRLERLKKTEAIGEQEQTYGDIKLVASAADNRMKIYFPGKPSEEVRKKLKGYGFRWAPSEGAWMLHLSNAAMWKAKEVVKYALSLKDEKSN